MKRPVTLVGSVALPTIVALAGAPGVASAASRVGSTRAPRSLDALAKRLPRRLRRRLVRASARRHGERDKRRAAARPERVIEHRFRYKVVEVLAKGWVDTTDIAELHRMLAQIPTRWSAAASDEHPIVRRTLIDWLCRAGLQRLAVIVWTNDRVDDGDSVLLGRDGDIPTQQMTRFEQIAAQNGKWFVRVR